MKLQPRPRRSTDQLRRLAALAAALAVIGGSLAVSEVATAATTLPLPCIPGAGKCPPAKPCIPTGLLTATPLHPVFVPPRNTKICPER